MEDRYPTIRFVVGVAQQLAATVAVILFFGGTLRSCELGGFAGFVSFLITVIVAGVGYVATMVWVESLRVFLDIEANGRALLDRLRGGEPESRPERGKSPA